MLLKFFEPVTDVDELPCAGEVSDGSDDGKDQYQGEGAMAENAGGCVAGY